MARKLKPEDKHVTRKELLAELLVLARATDASIAQLRAELSVQPVGESPLAEIVALNDAFTAESIPSPAEGPE